MYCEIKSKSSSNVIVPEMNRLNRDDLNKIKKNLEMNQIKITTKTTKKY